MYLGNNVPQANSAETKKVETVKPGAGDSGKMTNGGAELKTKIEEQGTKVRELKDAKAPKGDVDAAVKILLELKTQYKQATGEDYAPPGGNQRSGKKDAKKEVKAQAPQPPKQQPQKDSGDGSGKKQTRLGLEAKKSENLSDWFSQVIKWF